MRTTSNKDVIYQRVDGGSGRENKDLDPVWGQGLDENPKCGGEGGTLAYKRDRGGGGGCSGHNLAYQPQVREEGPKSLRGGPGP